MKCRYVRILGAFYLRLTGSDTDVYHYLEPLYNDYRKLRRKLADGRKFSNVINYGCISYSTCYVVNSYLSPIC